MNKLSHIRVYVNQARSQARAHLIHIKLRWGKQGCTTAGPISFLCHLLISNSVDFATAATLIAWTAFNQAQQLPTRCHQENMAAQSTAQFSAVLTAASLDPRSLAAKLPMLSAYYVHASFAVNALALYQGICPIEILRSQLEFIPLPLSCVGTTKTCRQVIVVFFPVIFLFYYY